MAKPSIVFFSRLKGGAGKSTTALATLDMFAVTSREAPARAPRSKLEGAGVEPDSQPRRGPAASSHDRRL